MSCLKKNSVIQNLTAEAGKSFTDGAKWAFASLRKQLRSSSIPMGAVLLEHGLFLQLCLQVWGILFHFLLRAALFTNIC